MEKVSAIYSETYNFVYLRAKSILQKEDDIQQLMREVYIQASEQDIKDEQLFAWLGKQTYIMGCNKFRKKKVREADYIELEEKEYSSSKSIDVDKTIEAICDALEDLPDMYQATLFAFYYDRMHVKEIAAVMGYNVGTILNRLNYSHKYLNKALENYQEEKKVKVQFSVEMLIAAMESWAKKNCMSENVAQNVFGSLCRDLSIKAEEIETEENEAGLSERVAKRDADTMSFVTEEFGTYVLKPKKDMKKIWIVIAIAAVVILTGTLLVAMVVKDTKQKAKEEEQKKETISKQEDEEEIEEEEEAQDEAAESEYIFPNSDKELLTREDLAGLSKEQLRLARNELFARYGTIFGVEDLVEYFGSKSWYTAKISFDEFYETIEMNEIEEANLALIIQVEEETE